MERLSKEERIKNYDPFFYRIYNREIAIVLSDKYQFYTEEELNSRTGKMCTVWYFDITAVYNFKEELTEIKNKLFGKKAGE